MTEQHWKFLKYPLSVFVFFILIGVAVNSMAEMYKWVDKNGVTRFSDTPPPDENQKLETRPTYQSDESDSDIEKNNDPDDRSRTLPPEKKKKVRKEHQDATVELYVTNWCPWCKKTKAFFQSKGVSVTEYDIEKDKEAASRKTKLDSRKGVPFTVINGKGIHGYNEAAFENALQN